MIEGTANERANRQDVLLTRVQLAEALKVSLRSVDLMLADGEITPMRLRGKMVRFYLPDVLQELREKAKTSKRNVTRRIQKSANDTNEREFQTCPDRAPKHRTLNP